VQVARARPPNQPHRGDVAKLLVHRSARRRGIGTPPRRSTPGSGGSGSASSPATPCTRTAGRATRRSSGSGFPHTNRHP
jgi:hypothetical protein